VLFQEGKRFGVHIKNISSSTGKSILVFRSLAVTQTNLWQALNVMPELQQ